MFGHLRFFTPHSSLFTPHLLFALILAGPVLGQEEHHSHVPVPLLVGVDPAKLFQERIQQARLPADLAELLKQLGANGTVRNADQFRRILQSNPQLRDLLRDPEGRDLLDKAIQMAQLPPGVTPEMIQRKLDDLQQSKPAGPTPTPMPRPAERPPIDMAEQARKRELANQLAQWAEQFPRDRLPESVRNSPAVKDLFQRLSESATDILRNPGGADGLDALARLETRFQSVRDWLPKQMPAALRNLRLPDLSRFSPNVRMPHFAMNPPALPSAPHFVGPGADARTATNVLLAGIGIAIVAVIVWRLFGGPLSAAVGGQRRLGPWPLDIARVTSRVELIQAFEYLSLLRCGEPARTWHHRAIAECLGGTEAHRRDAAARLAELYEQARYAPADNREPDWSTARGPLTLLAGAG